MRLDVIIRKGHWLSSDTNAKARNVPMHRLGDSSSPDTSRALGQHSKMPFISNSKRPEKNNIEEARNTSAMNTDRATRHCKHTRYRVRQPNPGLVGRYHQPD